MSVLNTEYKNTGPKNSKKKEKCRTHNLYYFNSSVVEQILNSRNVLRQNNKSRVVLTKKNH